MATSTISFEYPPKTNESLNDIIGTYHGYVDNSCTNKPSTHGGALISLTSSDGNYGGQIFIDYYDNMSYIRGLSGGTWSNWQNLNPYIGSHSVRTVGFAISASEVVCCVPFINPLGTTPTVSSITAALSGIGNVTAAVDNTRTNKDTITFSLTGYTFEQYRPYLCQLSFTLS